MPTYEYECRDCGHRFEQFQSIKARPLRKCPECGRSSLQRLIGTGAGVIFKGSGFYQTDYRSESYKKAAEAESGSTTGKTDKPDKAAAKDSSAGKDTAAATPAPQKTPDAKPKPKAKSA